MKSTRMCVRDRWSASESISSMIFTHLKAFEILDRTLSTVFNGPSKVKDVETRFFDLKAKKWNKGRKRGKKKWRKQHKKVLNADLLYRWHIREFFLFSFWDWNFFLDRFLISKWFRVKFITVLAVLVDHFFNVFFSPRDQSAYKNGNEISAHVPQSKWKKNLN